MLCYNLQKCSSVSQVCCARPRTNIPVTVQAVALQLMRTTPTSSHSLATASRSNARSHTRPAHLNEPTPMLWAVVALAGARGRGGRVGRRISHSVPRACELCRFPFQCRTPHNCCSVHVLLHKYACMCSYVVVAMRATYKL